jgi:menaquinol-cytochrome c reductase iron-sulfur subunit
MENHMDSESVSPSQGDGTTRRGLLKWAVGWLSGAILALIAWPLVASLIGPMYRKSRRRYLSVGRLDAIPLGTPTKLTYQEGVETAYLYGMQKREVWVMRHSATSLTVFSPICPHLACRLFWSSEAQKFVCPCHGSVFSITGEVLAGPSPRPLDALPYRTEDGQLLVLWEEFKPGITEKVLA